MKVRTGGRTIEIADGLVRGAVDARHSTDSGSRRNPASQKTSSQRGELAHAHKYDSKWEERYATMLDLEQKAGNIVKWWYHPWSMRLPGGARYAPDFMVQWHGHIEIIDVKGWHKNIREAMLRIKVAAAIYTCYVWYVAKWNGKHFDSIPVEVDPW